MTLYVINPNSSIDVTDGIARAVSPVAPKTIRMEFITLHDGPPGIETDEHVADAERRVIERVDTLKDPHGAIVACFSDPGVTKLKDTTRFPVIGIREASVRAAMKLGGAFGVIAIGAASVPRHLAAFQAMGVMDHLAGDRPLGLSVSDLKNPDVTAARMIDVAHKLRDLDGAEVLILGCAGMPQYRELISHATGLPVIEPCTAAVAEFAAES